MSANIPLAQLERLLFDDAPYGDLTTDLLGIGAQRGRMTFSARGPMVLALSTEAAEILEMAGASVERLVEDGQALTAGQEFLRAEGQAGALLRGWKVAQTLMEWSAGIASAVRDIRDAARAVTPGITIACTRKSVPLTRAFSIKAVLAGGGAMHRTGLGDTILVFPEHRAFLRDEELAVTIARLRAAAPERAIVVEVADPDDAVRAAAAGADVVQLEKFSPDAVAELRARLSDAGTFHARIAAAGGVTAMNAAAYAKAGADILVTSAPYMARPRDVQVRITAG